ncbi:NusA antitermination factor [Alicyclobacillus hesperidum URH17-3-68]|nr:NusA antitermination factor [Alicyclobacillus hesperidum URH17-3-68]
MPALVNEYNGHHDDRGNENKQPRLIGKQAECGTGVLQMRQFDDARDDQNSVTDRQGSTHDPLEKLIKSNGQCGNDV